MKSRELLRWMNVLLTLGVSALTASAAAQPGHLQMLIDQAPEQGEVIVPNGTWNESVVVSKPLKLRGASAEGSVIDIMADEPAVRVTGKGSITLESLTIRWQRAASERVTSPLGAVWVKDTPLTIRSVRFQAPGGNARCPVAIYALGFCDLKLEQCHIEGFEFPVEFSGAHKG